MRLFLALLGFGALVSFGPALPGMTTWPANWFALAAWVARLAG